MLATTATMLKRYFVDAGGLAKEEGVYKVRMSESDLVPHGVLDDSGALYLLNFASEVDRYPLNGSAQTVGSFDEVKPYEHEGGLALEGYGLFTGP